MQTSPRYLQAREGPNQQSNPLKQLFSAAVSPKQKCTENNKQKKLSNSIEIGNKYIYSLDDLIGDGFTSKVYKGFDL